MRRGCHPRGWALASLWGTAAQRAVLGCLPCSPGLRSLLSPAQKPVSLWPTKCSPESAISAAPVTSHHLCGLPNHIVPCRVSMSSFLTFLSFSGFRHACLPADRHPCAPSPCKPAALIPRGNMPKNGGPAASGRGAAGWSRTPPHLCSLDGAQGGR